MLKCVKFLGAEHVHQTCWSARDRMKPWWRPTLPSSWSLRRERWRRRRLRLRQPPSRHTRPTTARSSTRTRFHSRSRQQRPPPRRQESWCHSSSSSRDGRTFTIRSWQKYLIHFLHTCFSGNFYIILKTHNKTVVVNRYQCWWIATIQNNIMLGQSSLGDAGSGGGSVRGGGGINNAGGVPATTLITDLTLQQHLLQVRPAVV